MFTRSLYEVEVAESVDVGHELARVKLVDPVPGFFDIYSTYHRSTRQLFGMDGSFGTVTTTGRLDRESAREHLLTVSFSEESPPHRLTLCRMRIKVRDVNDHPPRFLVETSSNRDDVVSVTVFEGSEVGTRVADLVAFDPDEGENGRIEYGIVGGNLGHVFSIDPQLGILLVNGELDKSRHSEYMLEIEARDNGEPRLSFSLHVHVTVELLGTSPPV